MRRLKFQLAATVALVAWTPAYAAAQEAESDSAAGQAGSGEEIVVTGTRAVGRSRLDTASPVDVLGGNTLCFGILSKFRI